MVWNQVSTWGAMVIVAKLVLLWLLAMTVATPVLAVVVLRRATRGPMERGLLSIAASAPMLGLPGSVMGIISVRLAVATLGEPAVRQLAAGLGETMVPTALGLSVGIVAPWVHTAHHARLVRRELQSCER